MTQTTARIKAKGKPFEIIVDLDNALKFKKGASSSIEAEGGRIFSDIKKGFAASEKDLNEAFGTTDVSEITKQIVKKGEVLVTQEYRDEERDKKLTIPAIHTGKAYSIISQYKEEENWLNDGSLEATVSIPAGIIMDFYDKLNSATHGSVLTQEIKE